MVETHVPHILVSFAVGISTMLQASINVEFGEALGHGVRSAWANFFFAFLLIIPLVRFIDKPDLDSLWGGMKSAPWYLWFGGPLGAVFVTGTILIAPITGLSVLTVCVVLGSILASVLVDHFSILGAPHKPFTSFKALAIVLVVVGAAVMQKFWDLEEGTNKTELAIASVCAVGIGSCLPMQSAVNGRMAHFVHSQLRAVFCSFLSGTIFMSTLYGISLIFREWQTEDLEWYFCISPIVSVSYVIAAVFLPKTLGMSLFYVLFVSGQLSGSLVLDHLGAFSADVRKVTILRAVSAVVSLFGCCIFVWSQRRQMLQTESKRQLTLAPVSLDSIGDTTTSEEVLV